MVVNIAGVVDTLGDVEILEGDDAWVGFLVEIVVEFLREEIVVLRFTVTIVDAAGFLVVFITVDVVVFDGFNVVTGRLVGLTVLDPSDETDVRLSACETGFLVELETGFLVLWAVLNVGGFVVIFIGEVVVIPPGRASWIDWNVVSFMPSVVLDSISCKFIDVETFFCMIVPKVVVKPPTCTVYFSVVAGLLDDDGKISNVLLL